MAQTRDVLDCDDAQDLLHRLRLEALKQVEPLQLPHMSRHRTILANVRRLKTIGKCAYHEVRRVPVQSVRTLEAALAG